MLQIREEQLDLLSNYMLKRFEDRMIVHLRDNFPESTKEFSEAELRQMIRAGLDKANTYDVTDEVDVERYLEFMLDYGPDFDVSAKTSWAGEILKKPDLTGTEKILKLDEYELFELMAP